MPWVAGQGDHGARRRKSLFPPSRPASSRGLRVRQNQADQFISNFLILFFFFHLIFLHLHLLYDNGQGGRLTKKTEEHKDEYVVE